jgi:molecular chaperone DnaK (HSP70)
MAWGSWSRSKSEQPAGAGAVVGLDLTATRARAAYGPAAGAAPRGLPLDDPHPDLPLVVSLERRQPEVGRPAVGLLRRLPHLAVADFLPELGRDRTWAAGRHRLDAIAALLLVGERLRPALGRPHALAVAVPAYLSVSQATILTACLERLKLPVLGTAAAPVAVAAAHTDARTGIALVVDADAHALTWAVLTADGGRVRALASLALPHLGERAWLDRLLNAVSDRCVRLCRRDPRDSAAAEQALYEQIDATLDPARQGQAVAFTVRTASWYQGVTVQPDELDGFCAALARAAADGMRQALAQAHTVVPATAPPAVVWVTHAAARLPGLVAAVAAHLPESAAVKVLHPDAVAHAAHSLACAWQSGTLPRGHLDATAPLLRPDPVFGGEHLDVSKVKVSAPRTRP